MKVGKLRQVEEEVALKTLCMTNCPFWIWMEPLQKIIFFLVAKRCGLTGEGKLLSCWLLTGQVWLLLVGM
ncbi:hypothetical protein DB032_19410 [Chromobacterium sp. Panama]|nr:hypothetical protein DB032_19410 [Chromobacterium sp. Panama]